MTLSKLVNKCLNVTLCVGGCVLVVMCVPSHLDVAVDFSIEAKTNVVWMSKIYCLCAATPHPKSLVQFLVRFYQLTLNMRH